MSPSVPGINPLVGLPLHKAAEIQEGLLNRTLYQDGGVIRESGTKRIFAHLKSVSDVAAPTNSGMISSLVNLGSAASLLNLGVSVVGFALLFRKLGQVQEGIRLLDAAVKNGFTSVSNRLDSVEARLVGLHLMGLRAHDDLARIEEKLDRVASQIDVAQFLPLALALEQLSEVSPSSKYDTAWFLAHAERAQNVRLYCIAMMERSSPREIPVSDARFVALRAYIAVSAIAVMTEARCLRAAGDTKIAIKRLEATSEKLLRPNQEIVLQLLDGTPAVLGARHVEGSIGRGNAAAIARFLDQESSGDTALDVLRDQWTERVADGDTATVAKLRSIRSDPAPWHQRAEAARQAAEVYEVLTTMRAEYEVSERLNITAEQWEHALEAAPAGEIMVLTARAS